MKINALLRSDNELMHNIGAQQPIVLSTRIRLARNLCHAPFPARAKASQKRDILDACHTALTTVPKLKKGCYYLLDTLANAEKALLVERHLISKELAESKDSAVFISRDQTCSVMVNEEDHLRIQIVRGGFHLDQAWKQSQQIDDALAESLEIAYSPDLGYLTACPTNLGTGLRASAMLHLVGLVFTGQMDKVIRALSHDGLAVRGWFGEGSDASGCIFQVSNQHTLGFCEDEILAQLRGWIAEIIRQEENARLRLLENDSEKLFDQIARATAILQSARLLTTSEAMTSLSFARLACDIAMLPQKYRSVIDRLFIESQPAHIIATAGKELDARERDMMRATLFREGALKFPAMNFAILDHNMLNAVTAEAEREFIRLMDTAKGKNEAPTESE